MRKSRIILVAACSCVMAASVALWELPAAAQSREAIAQAGPRDPGQGGQPGGGGGGGGRRGGNQGGGGGFGGGGGGFGGGGGGFGGGGFGGGFNAGGPGGWNATPAILSDRNSFTETLALIGELNMKPIFDLTKEQRQQIQALREKYKADREKWLADHNAEVTKLDEEIRTSRDNWPLESNEIFTQNRLDLAATAPRAYESTQKLKAILTAEQLKALDEYGVEKRKTENAQRRQGGGFGGPGGGGPGGGGPGGGGPGGGGPGGPGQP